MKQKKTIIISLAILLLAGISLFIALKLKEIGEKPVAPKPKAEDLFEGWVTPAPACIKSFEIACKIPSPAPILKGPTPPVHSKVDLSWNCDQEGVDCFALERYEYAPSGSCPGGKTCLDPSGAPVVIITLPPRSQTGNSTLCTYADRIYADIDKCVAYRIVAKDFDSTKTCENCTSSSDKCCLKKSNFIKICGLPAEPSFIGREGGYIKYTDNSEIEKGFKVYARTDGSDDFIDILNSEVPIATLTPVPGKGGIVKYQIPAGSQSKKFSIRAFTELCGCGGPEPTSPPGNSPTPTKTPTPTSTPGGSTATPTNTPTITPLPTSTPAPEGESYCDYLTASPESDNAVLTVSFTGKGYDTTRIKSYKFSFGDGEKVEFTGSFTSGHIQSTQHDYKTAGTFIAQLEILDDGDHWRTRNECKKTIVVSGGGTGATSTPVPGVTTTGVTVSPTPTRTLLAQTTPTVVPEPTEVLLPEAGIKLPALSGLLGGFLLLAIGLALIF